MDTDSDGLQWWRQCEIAWSARLQSNGYAVTALTEAVGNSPGTEAPLVSIAGRRYRAPDLLTTKSGATEYWEVKFRNRADVDTLTGRREFWMDHSAFLDYGAVSDLTGSAVWVVVFEGGPEEGRWLIAHIEDVYASGRREQRFGQGGVGVDAWVWPVDAMDLVVGGPQITGAAAPTPLLPDEGDQDPIPLERFRPFERQLRRRPRPDAPDTSPESEVIASDPMVALDVLCRSLGIPHQPRYSVLRIGGNESIDADELLGLLQYGIRVFVVSSSEFEIELPADEVAAFEDARLLERSVVPGVEQLDLWIVDGRIPPAQRDLVDRILDDADRVGDINAGQWRIVHAAPGADVLVTAGAGTGKTETMSERLVYLLATLDTSRDRSNIEYPFDLRLDEIVLVTFSRESAREMRSRIARTLLLRQRLCRRCVLPAVAWMMQLSNTQISTIHAYAKRLVAEDGGVIGLAPGFAVSPKTMEFRELVYAALSPHIRDLFDGPHSGRVPPAHLFRDHIEAIWSALENRGVRLVDLSGGAGGAASVDWGDIRSDDSFDAELSAITASVIEEVGVEFGELCRREQSMPLTQLVPAAVDVVAVSGRRLARPPRFVFVDEFQDTDATQLELVLHLKEQLDAHLFVVGDVKQGVYRFRGAEGNAFSELAAQWRSRGLGELTEMPLTRNFRSGRRLLASLHPHFASWGSSGWLEYEDEDELLPRAGSPPEGIELRLVHRAKWGYESRAASIVSDWRSDHPDESIAILCRNNSHAMRVQRRVQEQGVACQLLVGGRFFQSPAVLDLRVFLECALDPSDRAAVLELCETRWFAGLVSMEAPRRLDPDQRAAWVSNVGPIVAWHDRFGSLASTGSFDTADLAPVVARVEALRTMLGEMPALAWIVECSRLADPRATEMPGPDDAGERRRYGRCFDHLVTLIDETFADAPVSLPRLLEWLRLQIAVNRTEDEPFDEDDVVGRVTALTVHKSKGLEFDRVLLPNTWVSFSPFEDYDWIERQIALVPGPGPSRRLVWRWSPPGGAEVTNVSSADSSIWQQERDELVKDEARLLYVALTRAKTELVAFVEHGEGSAATPTPRTWGDLLKAGGRQ